VDLIPLSSSFLSTEKDIPYLVRNCFVNFLLPLNVDPVFVDAINVRNSENETFDAILEKDIDWINGGALELKFNITSNAAAQRLRSLMQTLPIQATEAFLCDNQGGTVASTGVTFDYWQGDEEMWQKAYNYCNGGIYFAALAFDNSTRTTVQKIAFPILEPVTKHVLGAMVVNLNASAIIAPLCNIAVNTTVIQAGILHTALSLPLQYSAVAALTNYSLDPVLANELSIQTSRNHTLFQALVNNQEWNQAVTLNTTIPLMTQILANPISLRLREILNVSSVGLLSHEVYLYDTQGVLMGLASTAEQIHFHSYYQGGTDLFLGGFNDCYGGVYLQAPVTDDGLVIEHLAFPMISGDRVVGVIIWALLSDWGYQQCDRPLTVDNLRELVEKSAAHDLPYSVRNAIVHKFLNYSDHPTLVAAVHQQNDLLFSWRDIDIRDELYVAGLLPSLAESLINNPAADVLKQMSQDLQIDGLYAFLCDSQGATVASSIPLRKYYHADAKVFHESFEFCYGGFYWELNGDQFFNSSGGQTASSYVAMGIPVLDNAGVIGVLIVLVMPDVIPDSHCDEVITYDTLYKEADENGELLPYVRARLRTILEYMHDPILVNGAIEQDNKHSLLHDILQIDTEWRRLWDADDTGVNEDDREPVGVQIPVYSNPISDHLRSIRAQYGEYFVSEIFVVDTQGAMIGATNVESRYYIGNENLFLAAFNDCNGHFIVSTEIDDDTGRQQQAVLFPVVDDDGHVIGIAFWGLTDGNKPYKANSSIVFVMYAAGGFVVTLILAAFVILVKFRDHPVIKISNMLFRAAILFGLLIMSTGVFTTVTEPTDELCSITLWTWQIGYVLVVGTLSLVTWRIYYILRGATKSLKKLKLPNSYIISGSASLLAISFVLLSFWQIFITPRAVQATGNGYQFLRCHYGDFSIVPTLLIAFDVLLLVMCTIIIFQTRKILMRDYRHASDHKEISISIMVFIAISVVFVPSLLSVLSNPAQQRPLFSFLIFTQTLGLLIALFGPRYNILARYASADEWKKQNKANHSDDTVSFHISKMSDKELKEFLEKKTTEDLVKFLRLLQFEHQSDGSHNSSPNKKPGCTEDGGVTKNAKNVSMPSDIEMTTACSETEVKRPHSETEVKRTTAQPSRTQSPSHSSQPSAARSTDFFSHGWKVLRRVDIKPEEEKFEQDDIFIGRHSQIQALPSHKSSASVHSFLAVPKSESRSQIAPPSAPASPVAQVDKLDKSVESQEDDLPGSAMQGYRKLDMSDRGEVQRKDSLSNSVISPLDSSGSPLVRSVDLRASSSSVAVAIPISLPSPVESSPVESSSSSSSAAAVAAAPPSPALQSRNSLPNKPRQSGPVHKRQDSAKSDQDDDEFDVL